MKELTPYQEECLTILMEECGETVQEICKIYRFGLEAKSHHSTDKTHIACLIQELGDIIAMIELVTESGIGITKEQLDVAKENKLEKVKKWMTNSKPVIADIATKAETIDVYQMSFDDIVSDMQTEISNQWSEEAKTGFFLAEYGNNSLIGYHHSLGQHIRNKYKLWSRKWEPFLIDNVDYSSNHPDNVSMRIIEELWRQGQK